MKAINRPYSWKWPLCPLHHSCSCPPVNLQPTSFVLSHLISQFLLPNLLSLLYILSVLTKQKLLTHCRREFITSTFAVAAKIISENKLLFLSPFILVSAYTIIVQINEDTNHIEIHTSSSTMMMCYKIILLN